MALSTIRVRSMAEFKSFFNLDESGSNDSILTVLYLLRTGSNDDSVLTVLYLLRTAS